MNFKKAKQLLIEGKKIRRPIWYRNSYWYLKKDETIYYSDGEEEERAHVHLNQLEADDWEAVEETKKNIIQERTESVAREMIRMEEKIIEKYLKNSFKLIYDDGRLTKVIYNNPKGTFMWAIEQMKQGKKVRRKGLSRMDVYIWHIPYVDEGQRMLTTIGKPSTMLILDDYEATDWEIVEEDFNIGCYNVSEEGIKHKDYLFCYGETNLEQLEKAIKRARELQ